MAGSYVAGETASKFDALPVICIQGPTACGKTQAAMAICRYLPVEIVSVDSSLVYRGMNIGTAKPDSKELHAYPHALVDIRDPQNTYSVEEFCRDARAEIRRIDANKRLPLLVGGTMFYFRSLFNGLSDLPAADPEFRQALDEEAAIIGWPALHKRLGKIDPLTANRIGMNDRQRIQRALEIIHLSDDIPNVLYQNRRSRGTINGKRVEFIRVALADSNRKNLHQRISDRFDLMLEQGFETEVNGLLNRAELNPELPALRMVGYRQMWAYLEGLSSFEDMRRAAIAATRQLAKRQLTWLRNTPGNVWFDCLQVALPETLWRYLSSKLANLGYNEH